MTLGVSVIGPLGIDVGLTHAPKNSRVDVSFGLDLALMADSAEREGVQETVADVCFR